LNGLVLFIDEPILTRDAQGEINVHSRESI